MKRSLKRLNVWYDRLPESSRFLTALAFVFFPVSILAGLTEVHPWLMPVWVGVCGLLVAMRMWHLRKD